MVEQNNENHQTCPTSTTPFPKVNTTITISSRGCGRGCGQTNFRPRIGHSKKSHKKKKDQGWTKIGKKERNIEQATK